MGQYIEKGDSIFIPFKNGESLTDSQLRPRIYKTLATFKAVCRYEADEIAEYAEVVRCKDCKYGEPSINAIGELSVCCNNPDIGFYEWLLGEDDFCSYGERKDNAD